MTNVKPEELNYNDYGSDKYDKDIVNSIPSHKEIHRRIAEFVSKNFDKNKKYEILDLGVGTGITSKVVRSILLKSHFDVVDFSKNMLSNAKMKLGDKNINYILGDYSRIALNKKYDLIISVIGIHHQNTKGKKRLFSKIYKMLKSGGVFILGDLITYKNKKKTALNNALHYAHLVKYATDEKTLEEWAYHQMFLNNLSPIEDQIKWLKEEGFEVKLKYLKINTALLICKKN